MARNPNLGTQDAHFYRPIDGVSATKVKGVEPERAIRLYCEQFETCWNLQVRSPVSIGGLKDGKDFIVANARLERADMIALRDAIDGFLKTT